MAVIEKILADIALPDFAPARQCFAADHLDEDAIRSRLEGQFTDGNLLAGIKPGWKVAITAGSRGICLVDHILKVLTDILIRYGAKPYIIGCMGSHGGTALGQMKILEHMGITEAALGVPVCTSDDVTAVGTTVDGRTVYADSSVVAADALVVVNRIKPHTAFHAPVESGLLKMLAIGLGKQPGADSCHARGFDGMYDNVMQFAKVMLGALNVAVGVGIVENAYGKVADCVALPGNAILEQEPAILDRARALMPRLLVDDLDVLIVTEMGKDISGPGMDTNIIGRYPLPNMTGGPKVNKLAVLSLTSGSEGNAHGVGFADFVSARLFRQIDMDQTYPNCLTNKVVGPAKIPPVMPSDRAAIAAAVKTCGNPDPARVRAMWIRNTHDLDLVYLSAALVDEARREPRLVMCDAPRPVAFTADGAVASTLWDKPTSLS